MSDRAGRDAITELLREHREKHQSDAAEIDRLRGLLERARKIFANLPSLQIRDSSPYGIGHNLALSAIEKMSSDLKAEIDAALK